MKNLRLNTYKRNFDVIVIHNNCQSNNIQCLDIIKRYFNCYVFNYYENPAKYYYLPIYDLVREEMISLLNNSYLDTEYLYGKRYIMITNDNIEKLESVIRNQYYHMVKPIDIYKPKVIKIE